MKFGIWDQELNELIQRLDDKLAIPPQSLKAWLYTEGIVLLQANQAELHQQDERAWMEKFNHRPIVTFATMLGQKTHAFIALQEAALKNFVPEDFEKQKIFIAEFSEFTLSALKNHYAFYRLQARITTEMNALSDAFYKFLPEGGPLNFVIQKFREYKTPELELEIEEHIKFMEEFRVLKARHNEASLLTLFKPAPAKTEALTVTPARNVEERKSGMGLGSSTSG